jgi:hypothetical protein
MTHNQTHAGLVLCAAAALLAIGACSHTTPYRRGPVATSAATPPVDSQIRYRILLIGDAGEPRPTEPVLDSLLDWSRMAPERTLVVFLGDNAYPKGVTLANQADAERRLRRQLDAVGSQ